MNETVRDTMRQELLQSRSGFGFVVGASCFFGLSILIGAFPGLAALLEAHDWMYLVIIVLCAGAGWIAGAVRIDFIRTEIKHMDDDTLRFRHGEMTNKKLKSSIVSYLIVALVVAYLIFRN